MGIPEYEAKRYESFINNGGALLAIHADDREWAKKARAIFKENGATGVDSEGRGLGDRSAYALGLRRLDRLAKRSPYGTDALASSR